MSAVAPTLVLSTAGFSRIRRATYRRAVGMTLQLASLSALENTRQTSTASDPGKKNNFLLVRSVTQDDASTSQIRAQNKNGRAVM